jgi:enamine deaminase RidA (YjgF/YER057c/UK114 family)
MAAPLARYAHGVLDSRSGLVLTSGQLAIASDGSTPDDVEAQAQLIFGNIDHILSEADAHKSDVLRINAYVTDREHMAGYMRARDRWLSELDHLPASTLMIVSGFTRAEFLVEIEVTARRS